MDVLTPEQRHKCMTRIRDQNTKPEMQLRKALFAAGLRYRIHVRFLPGKPDLAFAKFRAVVFVHGCFWHGHNCDLFVVPKTNRDFWLHKIGGNRERDERVCAELQRMGWRVMTVWECALRGPERMPIKRAASLVEKWLRSGKGDQQIGSFNVKRPTPSRLSSAPPVPRSQDG